MPPHKDSSGDNAWSKNIEVEENGYYWKEKAKVIQKCTLPPGVKPVVVELFCGCGGTSLGFEMAGFEVALGIDIHEPSINTFVKNHPNSGAILGDVKSISPKIIRDIIGDRSIDVLIGGVPCQGFSLNNRKRHEDDKRNLLYREFLRFVKALKPKCVVLENVSGMRSTGDFVERIESDLSVAMKSRVKSKLLNAENYGVPQRRQRLVFVGVRDIEFDFSTIVETHGKSVGVPVNTVYDALGDLPKLLPGQEKTKYTIEPKTEYQKLMRMGLSGNNLTNHKAPSHPLETIERIKNTKPGEPMYPAFKQRIRLDWKMSSPTQVSGGIRPQFQFGHPSDPRGLSIRERCRIQSFPDTFEVVGGLVQGRVQTGNAVPPLLAKAVALAIKKVIM